MQHSLFCSADIVLTKSCAATNENLHCNIEKTALRRFPPLSCEFQVPTFRRPCLGPEKNKHKKKFREVILFLRIFYSARSPENFCGFFLRTCLGILHWKLAGIFSEFFLVSVPQEMKHENSSNNSGNIRSKIRGKIRDENSKNSGNFRSATFLT